MSTQAQQTLDEAPVTQDAGWRLRYWHAAWRSVILCPTLWPVLQQSTGSKQTFYGAQSTSVVSLGPTKYERNEYKGCLCVVDYFCGSPNVAARRPNTAEHMSRLALPWLLCPVCSALAAQHLEALAQPIVFERRGVSTTGGR